MKLKQLLFVVIPATGILSPACLPAQVLPVDHADQQHIYECLSGLGRNSGVQALKGTAAGERLIAYSWYDRSNNQYVLRDTTRMKYSGSRTSHFNSYLLRYWFNYLQNFAPGGTYRDISDMEVAADSFITYQPGVGTDYRAVTYAFDNRIAGYEAKPGYLSSYHSTRERNWYNVAGYIHTALSMGRTTANSPWDSLYMRKLTYTSSGLIASDSGYTPSPSGWEPSSVQQYVHDLQGNLIMRLILQKNGTAWEAQYRETYGYDALSRPVARITEMGSGGMLQPSYLDSFFYSGTNPMFHKMITHNWDPILKWEKSYMQVRHFNSALLVDTSTSYLWEGSFAIWRIAAFTTIHYNTRNNPTRLEIFPASISLSGPDNFYNYYYEPYNPADVGTIGNQHISIFPNPATDNLGMSMPELKNVPKRISITDITGKMLLSEQIPPGNEVEQIDISGIAPGAYMIQVATSKGNAQEKFIKK